MAWYDQYPERLEFELRALQKAGFSFDLDVERKAAGQLVLTVRCHIEGAEHPLTVIFPTNYPYFPFQVLAPTLNFEYHQDRYSKVLCFIARIDSEWQTTDTVAKYLDERLPEILKANQGGAGVAEAQEGAPATGFMVFEPGSVVITADWNLDA